MSFWELPIRSLKGVGEKRAALFKKLGIETAGDLLHYYPRAYQDFSEPMPLSKCLPGEICCFSGVVVSPVRKAAVRKGLTLYKLRVADNTAECDITFFNNRFIPELLHQGQTYLFYGRMGGSLFRREMTSPEFEKSGAVGLRPIYPATEGLPSRTIRAAVAQAFMLCDHIEETLPDSLRAKYGLCHLEYALKNIHMPQTPKALEIARRRLGFGELLALTLGMQLLRNRQRTANAAVCAANADFEPFFSRLPFKPTGAQRRAVAEAAADMAGDFPMNRLIEGDVGSGKTVVAAALCWHAARNGLQSAFMVPTEILARQHYQTLAALLKDSGVSVGLLTGGLGAAEKKRVKQKLARGEINVVVGTHALIQENVEFKRLGLVVTDEQHRFGVQQRARLHEKGESPHMLIMSATPIPRTLALMIYGDLDISVLDELPAGRQEIETYCVDPSKRPRVYAFIKKHLRQGFQAYIVCPLVEEGEGDLAAAEEYASRIATEDFAGFRVGLMHGRLKPAQKEQIMAAFAEGSLDLLVSTTVIEVGVDVPNAVIMVVENAERFGLSQLHQLRGRVGRGSAKSYCILISDSSDEHTAKRLRTLCRTRDGFKIAEKDLELRGPGDFFGHRQHGLPELRIANIAGDMAVLNEARAAAQELLARDPTLSLPENAGLRSEVSALFSNQEIVFN